MGSVSWNGSAWANFERHTDPHPTPDTRHPRAKRASRARLDAELVSRGLAESRARAQALVLAGVVDVDGRPGSKPGMTVGPDSRIEVRPRALPYVSRGGLKLAAALDAWPIAVDDRVALDVGASTGGFTDVLLQRGARRVYALDVGHGQLHYRLRQHPRVVVMERVNVRYLESLPERPELAVVDVSFISLRLVLPPVFRLLPDEAPTIALVKPQFEAGRDQVGRGGIVRDPAIHVQVMLDLVAWSATQPWRLCSIVASPIRGADGNVEFLTLWQRGAETAGEDAVRRATFSGTCSSA
ncbi:MAG: TlyA family RNA methyltransferase [Chloroflexi bacterium]|nr:TlyA family RNA methyltransferase [Chloroflexota bacterium]